MNNDKLTTNGGKRSKERFVWEVIECVEKWRGIHRNGDIGQSNQRVTLLQAAEMVKVPKKTLEDYYNVLKKASQILDLKSVLDKKMGYLRNLVKNYKPPPKNVQLPEYQTPSFNQKEWDNMIIEDDPQEKNFDIEEFFDLNSNPRLRSNSRNSAGVVVHDEMDAEYKWSISDCHPAFPQS